MVMHAGDMAWVLPELVWHLEDLRVGMCYQNHYIARLASKFVTVALAGTGGDELFAGYPWRYELVDGRERSGGVRATPLRVLERVSSPTRRSPSSSRRASGGRSNDVSAFDAYRAVIAPADDLDPVSRALYFEARPSCTASSSSRTSVSMAHEPRVACAVPRQRAGRDRAVHSARAQARRRRREADSPEGDGERPAGSDRREEEAGLQPARPIVVPRPDDGRTSSEVLLDPRSLDARVLRAERSVRAGAGRACRRAGQPPAADLVAAQLRMVEPPVHRR